MNIEEKANKIIECAKKLPPEANYFGSVDHIKMYTNEIIELADATRWRKVEEELPELIKGNFYYVIGEHKKGTLEIETIANKNDIEYVKSNWDRWKKVY